MTAVAAEPPVTDPVVERRAPVLGSTTPRLWTRPLVAGPPGPCTCGCALTEATSWGLHAVRFATEVLGVDLLPWQRWWLIHALELAGPGQLRFRTILTLIARQNGKTTLLRILALWVMFCGKLAAVALVLGVAQTLEIAKEAWQGCVQMARANGELADEVAAVRRVNGDVTLELVSGARYKIAATGEEAGRGLPVHLLVLDELRAMYDTGPWGALSKTTSAQANGLIVGISNAGSDKSTVLNMLRTTGLEGSEPSVALFEWSGADGCELDDREAWAAANPALGRTLQEASLRTSLATDPPDVFRTEVLCQHVRVMDTAVDPQAWHACLDATGSLASAKERVAVCLDVAPDGAHATLIGAAVMADGRVRLQLAAYWEPRKDGRTPLDAVRRDLPGLLGVIQPLAVGWFPDSPAAALAPELRSLRLTTRRERVKIVDGRVVEEDERAADELAGAMDREACQSFAALVAARQILHDGNELITAHVLAAAKKPSGSGGGWKFVRDTPTGHVDAAYAAAGAAYLARLAPPPEPPLPRPKIF